MLADDATVYVRTDRREVTYATTIGVLKEVFPDKKVRTEFKPFKRPTQTRLFGDHTAKGGEVDLILSARR